MKLDCFRKVKHHKDVLREERAIQIVGDGKHRLKMLAHLRNGARKLRPQCFNGVRSASTYALPELPYDYGALEPVISGEIMQLHHSKHHQAYVNGFNKALEQFEEASLKGDAHSQAALLSALKFNGGGRLHAYEYFFAVFSPPV